MVINRNHQQGPRVESIHPEMVCFSFFLSFCVNIFEQIQSFINAVPFTQYAGILPSATKYFNTSNNDIVWLSNIYYVDFIIFGVLLIIPIQRYLAASVILSSLVMVMGNLFIYIFKRNYSMAISSYFIFGIAQIVQTATPVFIADLWFPAQERTLATCLGAVSLYMGLNYGFIFPTTYLEDYKNQTEQYSFDKISTINLISLIISIVAFVLCCVFVRSKPATPPSSSANEERSDIEDSFRSMIKDKVTFMDLVTLSVYAGVSFSFISAIGVLLEPFNYTQTQIGCVGLSFQLSGTFSGISAAVLIDREIGLGHDASYDHWLKVLLSVSFVGIVLLSLTITLNNLILCCLLSGMVGFGLNGYFSIAQQSFVEKMYPCSELVIAITMNIIAQIFGLTSTYLVTQPSMGDYGLWILTAIQAPFTFYMVFSYKTEFNRTIKEKLLDLILE